MREKKLQVNKLKDARILNRELHQTLYGFIIFEVDWADVRGINYLNELQVRSINVDNPTIAYDIDEFKVMAQAHFV
jgi:hypothetical protein